MKLYCAIYEQNLLYKLALYKLQMIPSLVALEVRDDKRSNLPRSNSSSQNTQNTDKDLFELLSDEIKDLVLEQASRSSDCADMGKWCSVTRCDESVWQRACTAKGWNAKPPHFTWRIWYARNCKPNWAEEMDEDLIDASQYGNLDRVRSLLDRGADIHAEDDIALRDASSNGHLEVVRLLLDRGADIHAVDDFALILASSNGHLEVVRLLLDRGANVHANDDWALRKASENGHLEVVRLLLDRGANVHAKNDAALRTASIHARLEVVRLLLDRGADGNQVVLFDTM